jgi:tetratricopeptide (TPR) repeat protein
MFELLLQADKAIAAGLLDQAEKTYWQLIELDPSNAIAVAGLARIAMERGDARKARTFAERALEIDPDSTLARRLLNSIDRGTTGEAEDDPPPLPLLAVERLESMSRRRKKDVGETADVPRVAERAESRPAEVAESRPADPSETSPGPKAAAATAASTATPKKDGGKTRPDQIGSAPTGPLRERRQTGRLAAAAAAAAAAAREPARPRHEPHHAMPVGRLHFDPASLRMHPGDEFLAAEMAAAVAAVDDLDAAAEEIVAVPQLAQPEPAAALERAAAFEQPEPAAAFEPAAQPEPPEPPEPAAQPEPPPDEQTDLLGTVDDTAAEDSVALRLAMLGSDVDLEAAEREAAEFADDASGDMFEAAEAAASGYLPHEPTATAPDAAEPTAEWPAPSESEWPSLSSPSQFANADAADAEAAALQEVARSAPAPTHAAPASDDDRPYARRHFESFGDQDPTAEEAEAQALREAMSIVLAGHGEVTDIEAHADELQRSISEPATAPDVAAEPEPDGRAVRLGIDEEAVTDPQPEWGFEHDWAYEPEPKSASEPEWAPELKWAPEPEPEPAPKPEHRKGGFFHRIRGH